MSARLSVLLLWAVVAGWLWGAPARAQSGRFEPIVEALRLHEDGHSQVERRPAGGFPVAAGGRLLIPVRPGETLRVRGVTARTGLAFGTPPEVIAWSEGWAEQHRVRIPPAVRAKWLAVEVEEAGALAAERLAHPHDPLADKRFRQAARRWLRTPSRAAPAPSSAAAARWLELVSAAPESVDRRALSTWAMALLNELQLEPARLRAPWFHRLATRRAEVTPGRPVRLRTRPGEVVSLRTTVRAGEPTTLELWSGGQLVRRERWYGWERPGQDGYVRARRLSRVVTRGDSLELRISGGHARVRMRRYRPTDTLDALWSRWFAAPSKSRRLSIWTRLSRGELDLKDALAQLPREQRALASVVSLFRAPDAATLRARAGVALAARRLGSEPYRMAALWYLSRVGETPSEAVCQAPRGAPSSPTHYAIDLAVDALCGSHTPGAPMASDAFDRLLSRAPDDPFLRGISRALRRVTVVPRRVPLDALGEPIVEVLPVPSAAPDAQCRAVGRWRVFSPGEHTLEIQGDRPRVARLRAVEDRGARVHVAGFQVSVQAAPELESRARLAPGRHRLRVEGAPVLLKVGGAAPAPCGSLRRAREWWPLTRAAEVELPTARSTLLELVLKPARTGALTQPLVVRAGARRWELTPVGQPEIARVRLPLEDVTGSFALGEPYEPVLVQISVRQVRRDPRQAPAPAGETRTAPPATLEQLRQLSRAVRAAKQPMDEIAALRARAVALDSLGQRRFAEHDRRRLAALGVRSRPTSRLREGPLNLAARLPVLGRRALERLLEARRYDLEGDLQRAAKLYARIGAPAARRRAALLTAQTSAYSDDPNLALLAYAMAVEADDGGGGGGPRLSPRLRRAVRWKAPAGVERAGGSHVERREPMRRRDSLRDQIRRALLDAPEDAWLLREGEVLRVRGELPTPLRLRVEGACEALGGGRCALEAKVDGAQVPLGALTLPAGRRELEIAPSRHAMAWFRLCPARGPCRGAKLPLSAETRQRWYRADHDDPIELSVGGPTVVRLQLRAARRAAEVRVLAGGEVVRRLRAAPGEDGEQRVEIPVFEASLRLRVESDLPVYARFLVAHPGEATPERPQSAAQAPTSAPEVSDLGLPAPQVPDGRSLRTAGPLSLMLSTRYLFAESVDLDPKAADAPYLHTELRALRWFSRRNLYTELSLFARSRRGGPQAYGLFARGEWRERGLRPRLSLSQRLTVQRLRDDVHFLGERAARRPLLGARTRASVRWRYSHPTGLSLLPGFAFSYRYTDRALALRERPPGPDPLVFTDFASDHPLALVPALILYYRPLLDLSLTTRTSATTNAELLTFRAPDRTFSYWDRVEQLVRLDLVTGHGLAPWTTLEYRVSHRFRDQDRARALWRHRLTLRAQSWSWLREGHRLALTGSVGALLDRVDGRRQLKHWLGLLELSWLWAPGRGVSDLPASETEFEERMNEGSGLADSLDGMQTIAPTIGVGD